MNVKYCPECGTQNEAGTKFCTECGTRFPEETFVPPKGAEQDTPAAETGASIVNSADVIQIQLEKKKKRTGLVIALVLLAFIIAAGAFLFFTGNLDKMIATSKAGAGDYVGAFESYEKYLSRSGDRSTEAYTQASLYALSAGDADKALMYAKSVPERSAESDSLAEKAAIVLAKDAIAEKDWQGAVECLRDINGNEAKKLADEANYHLAAEAAENEEFESAIALLENNSFELSDDLISEYRYSYGVALMNEGKYEEAIAQFDQTSFADSDDLRGECYFRTSVDYAFLSDLKDACFDVIANEAAIESIKTAAEKLGGYSDRLFNDSELAFFADELKNAFLGECEAEEKYGSVPHEEYQKGIYKYFALESECLEIINEMYPFAAEDWSEISSFFETPERWNGFIAVIDQISKDFSGITKSSFESETQQFIELPNNTDYKVSITVWFYDFKENGDLSNKDEISAVLPAHEATKLVFTADSSEGYWDYEFRIDDYE
ncbi:MAG: zinc-ribbon domain-containing protein [Oscillospiraceae bacterium]|nr:zinc-ribbon domain-containing protein [Oscillospiraceae bacterium]